MSTLITGGTGWIGRALLPELEDPVIVSRNQTFARERTGLPASQVIECDLTRSLLPPEGLDGVSSIVHLMGEPIAEGRWNNAKKEKVRQSRVEGTRNLARSLLQHGCLPQSLISASATGFYGDRGEEICDESCCPGDDFLSQTCVEWEQSLQPLIDAGVRVCFLRVGLVLGRGGGPLEKMQVPFRWGVGGRLGNGQQWMSWIHMSDLIRMIKHLLDSESLQGPFNATAPTPARNADFAKALGQALNRPALFPVPRFGLKLVFGELADFLLASQRVIPSAVLESGFQFQFPEIQAALQEIFGRE